MRSRIRTRVAGSGTLNSGATTSCRLLVLAMNGSGTGTHIVLGSAGEALLVKLESQSSDLAQP